MMRKRERERERERERDEVKLIQKIIQGWGVKGKRRKSERCLGGNKIKRKMNKVIHTHNQRPEAKDAFEQVEQEE